MDGQNSEWPNTVQQAVFTKFIEIIAQSQDQEWSELAAIVLYDVEHQDELDVVCIATGTKTICPDNLRDNGTVVIDHHAEILARRCFVNYLYKQLDQIDQDDCILVKLDDSLLFKYKLKDNIKIILYISSAPCGGCRLFSQEYQYRSEVNLTNHDLDQLRCKAYKRDTFRNELEDNPDLYQVMSCSDKITKWNVLGVQGALLSRVIVPIYLEHIVISQQFPLQREHLELERAYCEQVLINRISGLDRLPAHYKLNKCQVHHANTLDEVAYFKKIYGGKPEYSINWIKDDDVEILRETTGLINFNRQSSRLCKLYRFGKYKANINDPALAQINYELAKLSNLSYQTAKSVFKNNIKKNGNGTWRKVSHCKKCSLDNFPKFDQDDKLANRIYLEVSKQVTMLNQQLCVKISSKFSAIVVTNKRDHDYFDVISLATDTNIFENEHVNNYDSVLLTRKCLINYMMDQLNKTDQKLFIKYKLGRYTKNPDIQLNLFISEKPSTILSEKSSMLDMLIIWSFLGIQGAYLSKEVDPIHLENIVINDSTHKRTIEHSVIKKQNNCFVLRPGYNKTKINIKFIDCECSRYLSDIFDDEASYSLNWIKDQEPELVHHLTGKNQLGETSRLSKDKHNTSIICQTNYYQVKEDLKSQLGNSN